MSTEFVVNVTVDDVKKDKGSTYKGDFSYEQTSGTPDIIDSKGNIDLKDVSGEADITFQWGSPEVTIDGQDYAASYYYGDQTGLNIIIAEGKDSDPRKKGKNPPLSGDDEFTVDMAPTPADFTLKDKNSDLKKYAYCMAAYVNVPGGGQIIDDPKIYNRPD